MTLKLLLFTLIALLSTICLLGQNNIKIFGSVKDTILHADLPKMTVCVLNAKDSTIVVFEYSKVDGSFSISNLFPGNFILLISYPNYADYVEKFSLVTTNTSQNFGSIIMNSKTKLLEAIIVKGKLASIQMKGDTTEYNAKAYVIHPNDKVEDLLKQLPGIQVDQNGKITAQGQTVTKVLLNGEEFFGDDPTIVTKNIRADMVAKVQLFNKKSDQSTFTGIDDGNTTQNVEYKVERR